jgi:uncharacterized protein YoxC
MKTTINQIKNSMENTAYLLDVVEERMSGIDEKAEELLHSDSNKEKKALKTITSKTSGTRLRDQPNL